jgi:hypothetical protein
MDDILLPDPDPAGDFFSDDSAKEDPHPEKGDALFVRMLSLPASSPEWQDGVEDLDVPGMERLVEAYRNQERRTGAIKILERRISKRRKSSPVPAPEPKPKPVAQEFEIKTEKEPEKPWFPERWKEVREAVKEVERPICYMCFPVYDALVEDKGIFDDKWGPEEGMTCRKEDVVWHWNVCFAARHPGLNLKLGA